MEASGTSELVRLGAAELARRIAAREVSSREAVAACLERIEAVNPRVNALRVTLAEEALAAADGADHRTGAGEGLGALHGVPFSVKENVDVAGTPTTLGLSALLEATATRDAPSVAGLRGAGAIPIARSNLAELGFRWHSYSDVAGHVVNPWDPSRTPGGSSGGEGAALATGMSPLGIGNDLGGSLRIPAQWNGIVSLRPTLGRVGDATTIPPLDAPLSFQIMAVNGPMARRVEDLRLALGPMSARDPRDPWQVPAPLAGPPASRRVAVTLWDGVHADVADGVRRAAQALSQAGYEVDEGEPPRVDEAVEMWVSLIVSEFRGVWPLLREMASPEQAAFVEEAFEVVPALDLQAHGMAYVTRQGIARDWSEWMAACPLVLAPVASHPPFEVDWDLSGPDAARALIGQMRMVAPVNGLGLPAVAVAAGEAGGLPQGVQVIGPRFREDLCLDAAEAIEAALGTPTPIDPR